MRLAHLLAGVMLFTAENALAQSVFLSFDSAGTTCSRAQEVFTPGTLYVFARLEGEASDGIGLASFRIANFPADWFANFSFNPGAFVFGNPLADGCVLLFQECATDANGMLLLATISYTALSSVTNIYLQATSQVSPPVSFNCPYVDLCVGTEPRRRCVDGGEAVLNPTGAPCTVGVGALTWGEAKRLFK